MAAPVIDPTVWSDWFTTHSAESRFVILDAFMPRVTWVAQKMAQSLSKRAEVEDLIGEGTIGLMQALDSFKPDGGASFGTWSQQRIWGAIMDWVRSNACSDIPRLMKKRFDDMQGTRESLMQDLGRPPTDLELMEVLDVTPEQYQEMGLTRAYPSTVSLEVLCRRETTSKRGEAKPSHLDPHSEPEALSVDMPPGAKAESTEGFTRMINLLPEWKMRVLMLGIYRDGLTQKEAGKRAGIGESNASIIHKQALAVLRGILTGDKNK